MKGPILQCQSLALDSLLSSHPGGLIGFDHIIPHTQGHEDVRRHVLCVRGSRGDPCIPSRSTQTQGGVDWVVIGVDQVMGGSGVIGVFAEDLFGDTGRLHIYGKVSLALTCSQQGQCIKTGSVEVIGVLLGEL